MTVSPASTSMPSPMSSTTASNTVSTTVPFASFNNNTEQFHSAVRTQLAQDIEMLFAYAELPSPLLDACRYVMTGQGKLVRPLLVASAFDSINQSNANDDVNRADEYVDKSTDKEAKQIQQNSDLESLLENDSDYDMARRAALAVELLHTYSLVHDDLPCMDDDEQIGRAHV